jgi:transposase
MNRKNDVYCEIYPGTINSQVVIEFFDKFSDKLAKPTVVVMDQASIHTSESLIEKLEKWEQKNLKIFWLPPYSPQQNLIEILWKFMKYEGIKVEAYESWTSLLNYLKKVLDNLGTEYLINFV